MKPTIARQIATLRWFQPSWKHSSHWHLGQRIAVKYEPEPILNSVPPQIYMHCGDDLNNQWNILIGQDSTDGYSFEVGTPKRPRKVRKIYSKYQYSVTSDGRRYRTISFSNLRAKDALAAMMERPDGAFGVPVDASKNYIAQMQSETKVEVSPGKWRWKKIKDHYHNHLWDCEVEGMVGCAIRGILKLESVESDG